MSSSCQEIVLLDSDSSSDGEKHPAASAAGAIEAENLSGSLHSRGASDSSSGIEAPKLSRQEAAQAKRDARDAARRQKVNSVLVNHARSGGDRRREIELMVSPTMFESSVKKGLLSVVRPIFSNQIVKHNLQLEDLLFWRRRNVGGLPLSSSDAVDAGHSLIILSPKDFISYYEYGSLDDYVRYVISMRPGSQILFAVYGIEKECRRLAQERARRGGKESIITMEAIQDVYTQLYLDHGIRVHDCATEEDAAKYIQHLTEAVAAAPYYRQKDLLQATVDYNNPRKRNRNRTTVMAIGAAPESQLNGDADDEFSVPSSSPEDSDVQYEPIGQGRDDIPFARPERSGDLGYMYTAMLTAIRGVSSDRALAIRARYPTLSQLLHAYQTCNLESDKERLLADVPLGNGRRLGPHLSRLIATVFTSLDPDVVIH